jgi:cytidyltransferase-like protein
MTYEDLPHIRERHKHETLVLCSDSFDLTHAGHILFFEDCKAQGDILVVMVGDDATLRSDKGIGRPVLNQDIRLKTVSSLKPVDYCFLWGILPNEPYELFHMEKIFTQLRPQKYIVNSDAYGIPYREQLVKKHGIEFVVLERRCPPEFENISTSKIIEKIKKI